MRLKLFALIAVALLAAVAVAGLAGAAPVELTAKLKGANEVPGPGDQNGRGDADVTLKRHRQKVCFHIEYRNIETASAGHIHKGVEGVPGPVKVTLFDTLSESPVDGCATDVRRKLITKIATHPDRYYVNLHNSEFTDGAIRGQLELASGH
jgi:hypothetical protein